MTEPLTITPAQHAELTARAKGTVRIFQVDGHVYVVRKPGRADWLKYKTDGLSTDVATRARRDELLCRSCLVPFDPAGTVAAERLAFDTLGDEAPAMQDVLSAACVDLAYGEASVREATGFPSPASPDGTPA